MKYVRFVVAGKRCENWRVKMPLSLNGIFTATRLYKRQLINCRFYKNGEDIVKKTLNWFNSNIPVPTCKWDEDVICWWKQSNRIPILKIRPLINVLRKNKFVVLTLESNNIGDILYRDKFQVVSNVHGLIHYLGES